MKSKLCLLALLCPLISICQSITIRGKIINEESAPVPGATITIKGTNKTTLASANGQFTVTGSKTTDTLIISSVGYQTTAILYNGEGSITVTLKRTYTQLDETVVMAYGTTTRRYNTGSISKITAAELSSQPVSNPLAALHGRVPGLLVTQNSGVTGSAISIQLRGQSSLDLSLSRNDPLMIIDGVPFESGNLPSNLLSSAANNPYTVAGTAPGGISPLNSINPNDIESIEVLKDADATAIYGSRGANGVILITTKKAKAGKAKFSVNIYNGFSRLSRSMDFLNTPQYLLMRKEALANDGLAPNTINAPDLLLWDTSRYSNLKKILIGNTARTQDWQASLSAGTVNTQILIGMAYNQQSNVFPGNLPYKRGSAHLNLSHKPASAKWDIQFSAIYAADKNNLLRTDLTKYLTLPPNIKLKETDGSLAWQDAGVTYSSLGFSNPFAELLQQYEAQTTNLSANLQFSVNLTKEIKFRLSSGYNRLTTDETNTIPKTSIAPENSTLAFSQFAMAARNNWILEPQLEYNKTIAGGKLQILLGGTFQNRDYSSTSIQASGYTTDLLLYSMNAAAAITASNNRETYRYNAVFARINYNLQRKYIVNLSARRDGSSRFGPGNRFANFAAAGLAWIFSEESFVKNNISFLSFGKLRASYGITGNDQIGDYRFLNLWSSTTNPYQGIPGLRPSSLFNPFLEWEKNKKAELAIELGFLNNRITFNTAYYRHRSSNQLISYRLPNQTGFSSVVKNLPAVVENTGWEIVLNTILIAAKKWDWKISVNSTIPSNKLLSFPGLQSSSYSGYYTVGKSLSAIQKIKFTGIDPATGLYSYEDYNKDGIISTPGDLQLLGNLDPAYYGGIASSLHYGSWMLDIFFDYTKQKSPNYLAFQYLYPAGFLINQPALVMDRWQKPGDQTLIQRFGATAASPVYAASSKLLASDGIFSDASFIRFKNLSLSYNIPVAVLAKKKIETLRVYMQAQNLCTFTKYKGADPETKNFTQLPPLKTLVFGIQLTF